MSVQPDPAEKSAIARRIDATIRRPAVREVVVILVLLACCALLGETLGLRWLTIGTTYALLSIVVSANEAMWGLGGLPSLGYNGFLAVGAYAAGIAATRYSFGPTEAIPVAVATAVGCALFVWPFVSRLPPLYFTITTLGFGLIVSALAGSLTGLTGGPTGLFGLPTFSHDGKPLSLREFYYMCWILAALGTLAVVRLSRSRMGLALQAMKANEELAASFGVDVQRIKLKTFLYGSGVSGFAGAIYAFLFQAITPDSFTFILVLALFAIQAVGGIGSGYGAMIGAVAVGLLDYYTAKAGQYTSILYGMVFLAVILIAPGGLAGALARSLARATRRHRQRAPSSAFEAVLHESEPTLRARQELRVESVSVRYGGVLANNNVRMKIRPGMVTGIVGANGAGKSTLLNVLAGTTQPDSGAVLLGESDITWLKAHTRAIGGIARTFQQPRVAMHLSVLDNVALGAYSIARSGLFGGIVSGRGQSELAELRKRSYRALSTVGAAQLANLPCSELSFGQLRLLEISRAVAMDPKVLLLDEPMSGLDAAEKSFICGLLQSLARGGIAVGLVEHDTSVVAAICDNVYVMDFGQVIAEAPGKSVFTLEAVRRSYMGEDVSTAATEVVRLSTSASQPVLS